MTVRHPPHKENVTSTLPITSLNVRNSVFLSSNRVLFPFDLYSTGHGIHVTASGKHGQFNKRKQHYFKTMPYSQPYSFWADQTET